MKQAILNVFYKVENSYHQNEFILFEGDILENLLPENSIIIQITLVKTIN